MANTLWKAAFNIWSEDSDAMVDELFTRQIHGDNVKYQGYHTLLLPPLNRPRFSGGLVS